MTAYLPGVHHDNQIGVGFLDEAVEGAGFGLAQGSAVGGDIDVLYLERRSAVQWFGLMMP